MYGLVRQRLLLSLFLCAVVAIPMFADDVTVSGNVTFSSLDGSSLDHDGATNGTFTVSDGNLTVLGTISCLDDGPGNNSACPMSFAVSGNFTMLPGSAIFAENRNGGGTGGDLTFNVGGNVWLQSSGTFTNGAVISSANDGTTAAGNIAMNVGGTTTFAPGTAISAGSKGGQGGAISVVSGGAVDVGGLVASGPSRVLSASRYSGEVVNGGSSNAAGGMITIRATTNTEPGVVIGGLATIVSQGEGAGSNRVLVEGCGIEIRGLVASVAKGGTTSAVSVRSGTTLLVDTRDLLAGLPSLGRFGVIRASSLEGSASTFKADLFATAGIQVLGPSAASSFFSVSSNSGASNATSGTIRVISLESTVVASGNAFHAGDTANNANGGAINVNARGDVVLDGATIKAIGGNNGKGGSIAARSYSGGVSWQAGVGDSRPTGSAITAAKRGTITLTYCTTVSTSGSSFPTNGSPVGAYPTTANSCSPSVPSLPVGETVPNCNDAPVALNDFYTVAEGGSLNVPAPGVLGNDSDADGDPITASLVSGPAHASSFTLNADGSFSYVHDGGESTTDSFTYTASDGSLQSNVATVNIAITPVNDPPVANDDFYTVAEGGTINFASPGVLSNDTDPDGPALTTILITGPAHASSFMLNPNGAFTYVHDGSETTSDSFTYQVTDGSLFSNVATVSITITPVNDAPVANNDGPYSVAEGGTFTLTAPGVLGNDTDAENNSLNAVLVSGPANASSFALNADGSFTYVHNGGETTSDSFTYKANDGSLDSNVATVTITITAVNDAPVANNDGPYTVAEGGTFTLVAPGVLANDTDAENNSLNAILVSGPANASSFTLNPNGSFTYVHDGSETTSDSFTYKANDGSLDSNVATVTITITAVNDAPVAVDDAYGVNEGGTLTIGAPGVLGNDTDAENNSLTAALVSGPANASSFTLNADGSFTYVHDGSETTSDTFTYKANDGSLDSNVATVTITITGVNDAPVAVNDGPYAVAEGGTFTLTAPGVLGNDTDPENDSLNAVLVSGPANASSFTLNADGSFTYVHDGSETTTDSFTYKANDGALDSNVATVTITITPVNDAPVAVNDAYGVNEGGTLTVTAPGVLGNDTDAENNALNAVLVSGPANAASFTLNADGSFTYVHNGSETLTDSFTYRANDGSANSNVATVTITITPVNDAPVANNDGPYNVTFHGTINIIAPGVLGNDTDAENNSLTAILVSGTTQGTLALNADGSFSYTHTGPTLGTDSFTYLAQDSLGAQSAPATVTINIINLAPTPSADSFSGVGNTELRVGTGAAAHPAVVVSGSVLANDTDPDSGPSPLTVTAFDATSVNGGSVTMLPNGTFNYLPAVGFVGSDSFNYTVTDGIATASATVTIGLTDRVWYVNPVVAGPQTGRSTDPFATIGQAQAASAINDYIHVAQGAQATGILLKTGQRLIGSGVALIVGPFTLAPATVRPTLSGTIILASNNIVTGLNVTPIGGGIVGNAVAGGAIAEVGISGGGDGLSLTNATGVFGITNVSVAPGAVGVRITGGTASITATNLTVSTTGFTGILGTGTGAFNFNGGTVTTVNGTAVDLANHNIGGGGLTAVSASNGVDGIRLQNTLGTFAVNGTGTPGSGGTITNMSDRGVDAVNARGVTLRWMSITNNAFGQGVIVSNALAAASSVDVQNSVLTNNFSNALQTLSTGAGVMTVTANNNTFTNNNSAVVVQTSSGGMVVKITNNNTTFNQSNAINVVRSIGATGAVDATLTGNVVGATGVVGSGAACGGGCNGIQVVSSGSNTFNLLVSGNTVRQIDSTGIRVFAQQGSSTLNATITNNLVNEPVVPDAFIGIHVQSGAVAADSNNVCASITANTVTGGYPIDIFVRNHAALTTFRLPGYLGLGTDLTAVQNFIKANNTVTTVTAQRKTTVPANQYTGGAGCPLPAL